MPFKNSTSYDFVNTRWRPVGAVYGIMNTAGRVIYVGSTGNLRRRMDEHRADTRHAMHKYGPKKVVVEPISEKAKRLSRERRLIADLRPPANG